MISPLLHAHITQFIEIDEIEMQFIDSILISRPFKQGEIIVRSGEPARYLAYNNSGYTVTYLTDEKGIDHVIRFSAAGWWTGDLYSLSEDSFTRLTTKALCDGELLLLPRSAQNQLLSTYPKYVASYLGITPEFLSKIRKQLLSKK